MCGVSSCFYLENMADLKSGLACWKAQNAASAVNALIASESM